MKKSDKYNYCPYCQSSMRMHITSESRYGYGRSSAKVVFVCDCCGSKSPEAYIDTGMLNKEKVIEKMEDVCNFEEDGDEQCRD